MINRVVLVGRLTKDIELRYTANGIAVASFSLACNRPFKNAQGQQEADFISIQVWKKQAENAATYLKKGSMAGVDGRVQTRTWDKDDGTRVYVTEVVADSVQFLEPRSSTGGQNDQSNANTSGGQENENTGNTGVNNSGGSSYPQPSSAKPGNDDPFSTDGKPIDINDDDLPF